MPNTIQGNLILAGTAAADGFVLEMVGERLEGNAGLLTGVAVGGAGIAGAMFVQNQNLQTVMEGVAAGSLGWVGGKIRSENLFGIGNGTQTGGASGRVRPVRVVNNSNNNSSSRKKSNVVEM